MKIAIISLAIGLVSICSAMENTEENRSIQADRYLKVRPPSEDFAKMAKVIAKDVPESVREKYLASMLKNLDSEALTKGYKDLLIKTFTAGELKILADLFSLPEADSAVEKLRTYIQYTQLPMTVEIRKAMEKYRQDPAVKPSPAPTQK